jgi:ribosome-associated translation inhibitor RaiA
MSIETTVAFQGMSPSPAMREDIQRHAARLTRFAPRLQACDVTVRRNENRHRRGNHYLVRIRLTMPGRVLEAGDVAPPDRRHEDPYLAAHDAFEALLRQLEDHVRIERDRARGQPPTSDTPTER